MRGLLLFLDLGYARLGMQMSTNVYGGGDDDGNGQVLRRGGFGGYGV